MTVSSQSFKPLEGAIREGGGRTGFMLLLFAILGVVAFFWDGGAALIEGWSRPEYSYGPLVPFVSAFMLLREIRDRPPLLEGGSRVPGLFVIGFGLLIGFVGNVSQIPDLIIYGMIIVVGGLMLVIVGIRQAGHYWTGWLHLFFMVPLPNMIYWQVSAKLQLISSVLGAGVINSLGIPVYLEGNVIDLGQYQLQVAEACNGLRYLFPLMSFGYLFGVLYRGPVWQKVLLFSLTIPITVLMNSFRIGAIGVLVNYFGISQAEGFLHWFEGWIIFISCVVILYLTGFILQRLTRRPDAALGVLDLDTSGLLKGVPWKAGIRATPALMVAAIMLIASGAAWQLIPPRAAAAVDRASLTTFPMALEGMRGTQMTLDPVIEKVLAADDYLVVSYAGAGKKAPIDLFVSYYKSTTGQSGIHSPEVCIPGHGWEVSRWSSIGVTPDNGIPAFRLNRAIIQKDAQRQLVYYWFEGAGDRSANEYVAKFRTIWNAMSRGRTDGALVRLTTPVQPGETEAAADRRLQSFMSSVLKELPRYVPK